MKKFQTNVGLIGIIMRCLEYEGRRLGIIQVS